MLTAIILCWIMGLVIIGIGIILANIGVVFEDSDLVATAGFAFPLAVIFFVYRAGDYQTGRLTAEDAIMTVKSTGRLAWGTTCPHCDGTGRVATDDNGWYVDYNYQDGHETVGPMSKTEAVKKCKKHTDQTSMVTLIGPGGYVYTY